MYRVSEFFRSYNSRTPNWKLEYGNHVVLLDNFHQVMAV